MEASKLTPDARVPRGRSGSRRRPLRVVIIEDSARIQACLEEALREIDNLVIAGTADTEAEALSLLSSFGRDLAILDLQLKEGNGLGVLKGLGGRHPGKIAVLTNYAFPQYRKRSLALGADFFFDKSREIARMLELAAGLAQDAPAPA